MNAERAPVDSRTSYRFGRFELNASSRELLADGQAVTLGARAFDVLHALVERAERLVTKDELLEAVWPGLVVEENNLQVQISALRKILGAQAIATIPGRGYRFALPLAEAALVAAPAAETTAAAPRLRVRSRWAVALAAGIVVAGIVARWWWLPARVPAPPAVDAKSIAVLPFVNLSEDKANALFADGVQEDLLTQLAALGELKVVSRTSAAEYRDAKKNIRQIATELGVASLVEGSVRRVGDRVRVTVQLIDGRSDKHLWGNSYDRELKDIFAIQSDIAAQIARALSVTLSPLEQHRLAQAPTSNLLAYELMLRQKELQGQAMQPDIKSEERIKLLEQVVALDPKFALAWANLATELSRTNFGGDGKRLARAKDAISRALALAPNDIDVQSQLGNYYYYGERDYARAAQYFEKLLEAAPHHTDTLLRLAWVRRRQGRWLDVNDLLERLLAIDPRNVQALGERAIVFIHFRHFDAAWAAQRRITELRPTDIDARCILHALEYQKTGSWAAYDAWRAVVPPQAAATSGVIYSRDVRRAVARRDWDAALRLLDSAPEGMPTDDGFRAHLLILKGDREQGLKLARTALASPQSSFHWHPPGVGAVAGSAMLRALLGDRAGVLADFRRFREMALARPDFFVTSDLAVLEVQVRALLGDREEALAALARQFKTNASGYSPNFWRIQLPLQSLWDDPAFRALLDANNCPLPIVNLDPVPGNI